MGAAFELYVIDLIRQSKLKGDVTFYLRGRILPRLRRSILFPVIDLRDLKIENVRNALLGMGKRSCWFFPVHCYQGCFDFALLEWERNVPWNKKYDVLPQLDGIEDAMDTDGDEVQDHPSSKSKKRKAFSFEDYLSVFRRDDRVCPTPTKVKITTFQCTMQKKHSFKPRFIGILWAWARSLGDVAVDEIVHIGVVPQQRLYDFEFCSPSDGTLGILGIKYTEQVATHDDFLSLPASIAGMSI
jgi:hypothetical protein